MGWTPFFSIPAIPLSESTAVRLPLNSAPQPLHSNLGSGPSPVAPDLEYETLLGVIMGSTLPANGGAFVRACRADSQLIASFEAQG